MVLCVVSSSCKTPYSALLLDLSQVQSDIKFLGVYRKLSANTPNLDRHEKLIVFEIVNRALNFSPGNSPL
jgi:hypothetical protein